MSQKNDPANGSLEMRRIGRLLMVSLLVTFLLVTGGNLVRSISGGSACPDWPLCSGSFSLPDSLNATIEVAHRVLAGISSLLVLVSFVWVKKFLPGDRWLKGLLIVAGAALISQGILGALLVSETRQPLLSVLHLVLALITLGAEITAVIFHNLFYLQNKTINRPDFSSPFGKLTLVSVIMLLVLLLSGAAIVESGVGEYCSGWPLCNGGLPVDPAGWLALGHRLITLVTFGAVTGLFFKAWRVQRSNGLILTLVTSVFLVLVGQIILGGVKVSSGFPMDLRIIHAASSAAGWVVMMGLTAAVGFSARSAWAENQEGNEPLDMRQRFKDFIQLSKPIIVLLLLVTTYAGMVVGGKAIPSFSLTLWTMIGGALAAGGSSAINQYLDRELDKNMQRTAKRPLPDGRMQAGEGLAYGVGAVILSFYLTASFVNVLAALLSLAGMVYYVVIYSIWLKHVTVQNIVIGGGAGAIPPLVGWAAASGSLNIPAMFLFAIVFLWTPPHFWALALVRKNDYARAGVPMLPVVQGETATRKQVFIYTLELVGLTLLMPIFKITGGVFLISAVVLGLWLIHTAWKVLRGTGNKNAWKMYRYSSMYLAFIFLALVLDVLL